MDLFKKHYEAATVLVAIIGAVIWMTSAISSLKHDMTTSIASLKVDMNTRFSSVDLKIASIESDIRNINTVLICKGVMPKEVAKIDTPKCNGFRPYEDFIPKHDSRATKDTKQGE